MKAELVPLDGSDPIIITKDVTIIGRREFCDVQIDHPGLSKRHCALIKSDGLVLIRDLATTNGTKVKGQRVKWAALLPEDRITIGRLRFRIYFGPDDAPSPSEKRLAKELKATTIEPDSHNRRGEISTPPIRMAKPIAIDDEFEMLSDLVVIDDDVIDLI